MKAYLKHTLLFFLYHPVSYLAGGLIAGFPVLILGAVFETNRESIQNMVEPILHTIIPLVFLFYFIHRYAYDNRKFSPLMIIGSSLPLFIAQLILVYNNQLGMTLVGSAGIVADVFFPNTENTMHYVLVQIGLELLVYLPTYLIASFSGYKRRIKDIQIMIEEHHNNL